MTLPTPNDSVSGFVVYSPEKHVDSWKNLPQEHLDKLPAKDRACMKQLVDQCSRSELAALRITDLSTTAKRPASAIAKFGISLLASILSAMTFSAGMQVLTARLGRLGLPAAMLGAATAGLLVENRGAKAITRLRQRQQALKVLKALEQYRQHNPVINDLQQSAIQSKIDVLRWVETECFVQHFPVDSALAGGLSCAEYVTALWIVSQLALPGGLVIEAIAASLPIAILWLTAAFQSEYFELPDRSRERISHYQPYLFYADQLPEDDVKEIYCVDHCLKYVVQGDPSGQNKNLGMAKSEFEIRYFSKRKYQLEQEKLQASETRLSQYRSDVAQLPTLFPKRTGMSEEELAWEQHQWIAQKTNQLKVVLSEDLDITQQRYEQQMQRCDDEITNAKKAYDAAYQAWCDCRNQANMPMRSLRPSS
jgi:hypothetical protein